MWCEEFVRLKRAETLELHVLDRAVHPHTTSGIRPRSCAPPRDSAALGQRRHVSVLNLDTTSPPRPDGGRWLWGDGFEIETLIHVRAAKAGLVVTEVPSFEYSRVHGVSNLNAFRDGRRVLRTILTERHNFRHPCAIEASLPPMGQTGTAAHVVHESATSSVEARQAASRTAGADDRSVLGGVVIAFDRYSVERDAAYKSRVRLRQGSARRILREEPPLIPMRRRE